MPRYGAPERFAIEWSLDEDYFGPWLNGQARVWIGGFEAGSGWRWMSLRDLLSDLESAGRDWGRRSNPPLYEASLHAAYSALDGVLYSGTDVTTEARAMNEEWARHEILPAAVFGVKMFLVGGPDDERLVTAATGENPRELFLTRGEVDDVLRALRDGLRAQMEAELGRPKEQAAPWSESESMSPVNPVLAPPRQAVVDSDDD